MYEEWPVLEFPAIGSTILDLFTRGTSESVSASLIYELARDDGSDNTIRLQTEEQLRWCMQVLNNALSFSLSTKRGYESVHGAVAVYVRWLRALTELPDARSPVPLLETPEKYFRNIMDALRSIFCYHGGATEAPRNLAVERQATEIETVLDALKMLIQSSSRKYQDEVWSRSLGFMLNSADLLFFDSPNTDELCVRAGPQVVNALFDLWSRAVANEVIPSPAYWRTLAVLCRRWRHHVAVVEVWARKVLALTVMVVRQMYGNDYNKSVLQDDSILQMESLASNTEDGAMNLLYQSWFYFLSLLDSPVEILSHSPHSNKPLHDGIIPRQGPVATYSLPICFFVAVTTLQRMVDIFYGDSYTVSANMNVESCLRMLNQDNQSTAESTSHLDDTLTDEKCPVPEDRTSFSSSVSGRDGVSDLQRGSLQLRVSDRSNGHNPPRTQSVPCKLPKSTKPFETKSMDAESCHSALIGKHLEGHQLKHPNVTMGGPKSERLLGLTMGWLLEAALYSHHSEEKPRGDVCDDVISGLSLQSVDLDDIPDAMQSGTERREQNRREQADNDDAFLESGPLIVDGVSAGRAAALGALTRMICSKSTSERLPAEQVASYVATVYQSLIEKDRMVLCSLFYYGHSLFRLSLPSLEAILPHYLYGLDIVLIESTKVRLHPSISEVEMRRCCLRALGTITSWPTTFGMARIPQVAEMALKSSADTYLHLRSRMYKTLVFSLRNETDPVNLQMALSMCTILMEESCAFDIGLNDEQYAEMYRITTEITGSHPEKGLCVSLVRGLVSAVCDRICRPEWAGDHSVSLSAIDMLNAFSQLPSAILFSNNDVSTGSLIVASLCRFIEYQLGKPPPLHSKDLHSTIVAAFNSIAVWLTAAPILAECEGVLNTVAETIQLGMTGAKRHEGEDKKAASRRVYEAAEFLMLTLFSSVGRGGRWSICDERRLLYLYGPSAIDTTRFMHFLVNGDTIISLHEANHIVTQSDGCPCVVYVRRSPLQAASVGVARLRPALDEFGEVPPTPATASIASLSISEPSKKGSLTSQATVSTLSSVSSDKSKASDQTIEANGSTNSFPVFAPPHTPIGQNFSIPPEFQKNTCKLDTTIRGLEQTPETDEILKAMSSMTIQTEAQKRNVWAAIPPAERSLQPTPPPSVCDSIRVLLYDLGMVDRDTFGSEIVPLDSGQSADFYRDLHEIVDSCPSRSLQTAHIFYVKEGQRSAVDILDNALNIQNTSADFCGFLSELGEGIEAGVHDSWTGHWSTAFSSERKPLEEADPVDHYIIDGVTHSLWWADANCEIAFLMPTERSLRLFKQELTSPAVSSRRGSNFKNSNLSASSDETRSENMSVESESRSRRQSNLGVESQAYGRGNSSIAGNPPARRCCDLKVMIIWLEKAEDLHHFPVEELLCVCDDGGDKSPPQRNEKQAFVAFYLCQIEQGLIHVQTRGTPNRFGESGPLCHGTVVSLMSLPSLMRITLLNINRRSVAEVENYTFTHTKRRQTIAEFSKKYTSVLTYEDFLQRIIRAR